MFCTVFCLHQQTNAHILYKNHFFFQSLMTNCITWLPHNTWTWNENTSLLHNWKCFLYSYIIMPWAVLKKWCAHNWPWQKPWRRQRLVRYCFVVPLHRCHNVYFEQHTVSRRLKSIQARVLILWDKVKYRKILWTVGDKTWIIEQTAFCYI